MSQQHNVGGVFQHPLALQRQWVLRELQQHRQHRLLLVGRQKKIKVEVSRKSYRSHTTPWSSSLAKQGTHVLKSPFGTCLSSVPEAGRVPTAEGSALHKAHVKPIKALE